MNDGITFGTGGPMMTGTWFNPSNGDKFTVRDSFFENNQYMVSTTDGRLLNYNQIQHYVQMGNADGTGGTGVNNLTNDIPQEIMDMVETPSLITSLVNTNMNDADPWVGVEAPTMQIVPHTPISNNSAIIEKALSKTEMPQFTINFSWPNYPKRELEMLTDIMEVPMEEIVQHYINKFGLEEVKKMMVDSLNDYFNKEGEEHELVAVAEPLIVTEPSIKSRKKKTT